MASTATTFFFNQQNVFLKLFAIFFIKGKMLNDIDADDDDDDETKEKTLQLGLLSSLLFLLFVKLDTNIHTV